MTVFSIPPVFPSTRRHTAFASIDSMAADLAFSALSVSKTYGARKALSDGVSLERGQGRDGRPDRPLRIWQIHPLAHAHRPRAYRRRRAIEVAGLPVQAHGRRTDKVRQVRARTGFIFQQFNLVGRLSLFSNVMVGRSAGFRAGAACWALGPARTSSWPCRPSPAWASPNTPASAPTPSRAASSSAAPSPAPWFRAPSPSLPTSRSPPSTRCRRAR